MDLKTKLDELYQEILELDKLFKLRIFLFNHVIFLGVSWYAEDFQYFIDHKRFHFIFLSRYRNFFNILNLLDQIALVSSFEYLLIILLRLFKLDFNNSKDHLHYLIDLPLFLL